VEPVKDYRRNQLRKGAYTSLQPYTRLVDVARPESAQARDFAAEVDALPGSAAAVRRRLILWRDNDAQLRPVLAKSGLLAEAAPLSADVARLAAAGLAALDRVEAGKHDPAWVAEQQPMLDASAQPRAECLISIVEPIRKLIDKAK
jgi:hexosaminidase